MCLLFWVVVGYVQFHGTSFPHGIALMWRAVQVPPCRFSCVRLAAIFENKLPSPGSSAGFLPPCCRHLLLRRLRFLSIITALCAVEFACGLAVVFSVQSRFFCACSTCLHCAIFLPQFLRGPRHAETCQTSASLHFLEVFPARSIADRPTLHASSYTYLHPPPASHHKGLPLSGS